MDELELFTTQQASLRVDSKRQTDFQLINPGIFANHFFLDIISQH